MLGLHFRLFFCHFAGDDYSRIGAGCITVEMLKKKEVPSMSVEVYAAFAYALTAGIALVMIGSVVLLNKVMGGGEGNGGGAGE